MLSSLVFLGIGCRTIGDRETTLIIKYILHVRERPCQYNLYLIILNGFYEIESYSQSHYENNTSVQSFFYQRILKFACSHLVLQFSLITSHGENFHSNACRTSRGKVGKHFSINSCKSKLTWCFLMPCPLIFVSWKKK